MNPAGVRAAALAAALALALLSRGDVVVLALLLVVGVHGPLRAIGVVAALKATAWRWTSASLEHIAAAQSVLGPAGLVDPPSAAVSAWLAGGAIVLATPTLVPPAGLVRGERWLELIVRWLPRATFAAVAAAVVAGPSASDGLGIRVLAVALALAATVALPRLLGPFARSVGAVACGAGSLVSAAVDTPPLTGILDGDALLEGLALAAAVGLLAWVVAIGVRHAPGLDGRGAEARR